MVEPRRNPDPGRALALSVALLLALSANGADEVTLSTVERPPHEIEATLLKGNLKQLHGIYRIEPQRDGRILLSWSGTTLRRERRGNSGR